MVTLYFFQKKFFSAYSNHARLIFISRSQFVLFASRICTICAIYAVRYLFLASVNFEAYLRENSCFAAPFLFQLLPFACFGLFFRVCEGCIDLPSISGSVSQRNC